MTDKEKRGKRGELKEIREMGRGQWRERKRQRRESCEKQGEKTKN